MTPSNASHPRNVLVLGWKGGGDVPPTIATIRDRRVLDEIGREYEEDRHGGIEGEMRRRPGEEPFADAAAREVNQSAE